MDEEFDRLNESVFQQVKTTLESEGLAAAKRLHLELLDKYMGDDVDEDSQCPLFGLLAAGVIIDKERAERN